MPYHSEQTTEAEPSFLIDLDSQLPLHSGIPTFKYLTAAGDGTGAHNLNGDYSSAAVDAHYLATANFFIHAGIATISDSSKFVQANYGGLNSPLTNGVKIIYKPSGGAEQMMFNSAGIKANYEWLCIGGLEELTSFDQTAQTLSIVFDFVKMFGKPMHLSAGDKMIVRLNDNFTGIDHQSFAISGRAL